MIIEVLSGKLASSWKPRQLRDRGGPQIADPPRYSDSNRNTGDDAGVGFDRRPTTDAPRWVKVFGIIALILGLLFVILHLTGHGLGGHKPFSNVTEQGAQEP